MTTLDKVIQMQRQGLSDAEISRRLQNDGIAPSEINDSLNQAKIKNAVSPPEQIETMQSNTSTQQEEPIQQTFESQPEYQESYAPQYQQPQEFYPQDNYYQQTPQAYGQQDYYAPQGSGTSDIETISEIAEQVATEKINDYKKGVGDIISFKNNIQDKVDDIDDRLKRIETSIDKLQQAIIGKIGEFGENNAMIQKDLENIHGTMSKLMNPLIDNLNEIKKLSK